MEAAAVWGLLKLALSIALLVVWMGAFYYFSVLVHELGHLFAALFVGWKPLALCIGHGKRRTIFSVWNVEFQIGERLAGGRMYATPRKLDGFRTAQFLFALGGPVATACLAFVLYLIAEGIAKSPVPSLSPLSFWMLFAVECWELASNLWPRMVNFSDDRLPSDGLIMWRTLWMGKEEISNLFLGCVINQSVQLLTKGRLAEARQEFETGVAASGITQGHEFCGRMLWINLLWNTNHDEDARAECVQLLDKHPKGNEKRVQVLDELASIPVFYGQRKMLPDALEFIEQALTEAPEKITLNGTKGSLLVDYGEVDAGIQLLEEVLAVSESETDHAICTWYLALAYQKQGNVKKAQEKLGIAKTKYSNCAIAPRMEMEIRALPLERVEPELAEA